MYEKFYHMTHTPFSRKVPPEALYESKAMTDCLGALHMPLTVSSLP